jgi:hypothetical protein
MAQHSHRLLCVIGALFNWIVGLAFLIDAPWFLGLFGVHPLPTEPTFVQMVGGLVVLFGFFYYRAATDIASVSSAIWLGSLAKLMVFAVSVFNVVTGHISWHFGLLTFCDLVFASLFILALRRTAMP